MPSLRIRITGDKHVITALTQKFPTRLSQKILSGIIESAEEAKAAAITYAPRKYGFLRQSIRTKVNFRQLTAAIAAGSSDVPYAKYQEFGTMDNRVMEADIDTIRALIRTGVKIKRGRGIAPSLFLHRGVEKVRPRMRLIFEAKVKELLREVGLK